MQTGDVLLIRRKWCPVSWLICKMTKSSYNHVAWAVNERNVIEVRAKGVATRPLSAYLNKTWYDVVVLRPKNIDNKLLRQQVFKSEWAKVKYSYFSFLLNILLFAFNVPQTRYFCTSFIAIYLDEIGWHFTRKPLDRITPWDFEISLNFWSPDEELL